MADAGSFKVCLVLKFGASGDIIFIRVDMSMSLSTFAHLRSLVPRHLSQVQLYLYDLSQGMVKNFSRAMIGKQIDGIWHTGVVIHFPGSSPREVRSCPVSRVWSVV